MLKTDFEPEWFINTRLHVYITWFEYMHARHFISMHDRHLAFMQTCHLVIMRWPMQGGHFIILICMFPIEVIEFTI